MGVAGLWEVSQTSLNFRQTKTFADTFLLSSDPRRYLPIDPHLPPLPRSFQHLPYIQLYLSSPLRPPDRYRRLPLDFPRQPPILPSRPQPFPPDLVLQDLEIATTPHLAALRVRWAV
jgi:hypothetical protein